MSNSSNSGGKNPNEPKKVSGDRMKQEALVVQDFFRASQRQVETLRQKIGMSADAAQDLMLSDQEKKVLQNIQSAGMIEGICVGVATFIVLRQVPKYLLRYAVRKENQEKYGKGGGSGGYTLDNPSKMNSPFRTDNKGSMNGNNTSAPGNEEIPRRGLFMRTVSLMTDITLSLFAAAYTSAYMADVEKIKSSITGIPLMEGRSVLSDNFCPPLIEEFKRQWNMDPDAPNQSSLNGQEMMSDKKPIPPFDRKDVLKNPNSALLKGYIEFIENCHKRKVVEDRLREERGLGPTAPVEIPSPGINKAGEEFDNGGLFGIETDGGDSTGFSSSDFTAGEEQFNSDDDWDQDKASSFVEDQEDSARRK